MNAKFAKWGNSLALRIPSSFAQQLAVGDGTVAAMTVEDGRLIVRPVAPLYDLDTLINAITETNRHVEAETGSAVGNEFS